MERSMRSLLSGCLAALSLAAAPIAFAQALYKSTLPDGSVVYSEKPVPGAVRVEKLAPPPAKTGTVLVTPEEIKRTEEAAKKRAAEAAAREAALEEARRQLKAAEAARDAGIEPLPGERIGIAGGGSRLSEAYWERQKKLEQAVEAARKRLEEAQRAPR